MTHESRFTVTTRRIGALAAAVGLGLGAITLAHARGPEYPISLAEAQQRADARFQQLDADGSGEISLEEFTAAPRPARGFHHRMHRHGHRASAHHAGKRSVADREARQQLDQATFERLDSDGDGLLSRDEFDGRKLRAARHAELAAHRFARLDADGSGGLSRDELPDPSRWLAAMDADGDGLITRAEAREHRQAHRDARRAERAPQRVAPQD